jgi:RNA polymerase sigma-70 factor (ECF subfamily)
MPSEADLLAQARRFEPDALGQIYDHYSPALYRYALRLLGQPDLAEECVAETFSRFLLAVRRGGGPAQHLQAYLYRVAHNWITDQWRRQPPPPLELDADLCTELPAEHDADPAKVVLQQAGTAQIRAALTRLTPDQRQVVMLKYLEEWDNNDIAVALDKPVGAVRALQHRALAALRRLLFNDREALHEPA